MITISLFWAILVILIIFGVVDLVLIQFKADTELLDFILFIGSIGWMSWVLLKLIIFLSHHITITF